ncbi:AbrB-like transcriptional regulator involved in photosynthesis regulation [Synechococcus sp. A18-25c]|uniref:AbrB family transcriptional regulator n=1 Tax=unclassified Synechococcus TaxID=2626047 RepID=UPI001645DC5D|nr:MULTISPECIES: AbrB family transcriptional regulator [unclassified Synechococcus]QNI47882.1 AbrB-like transcriptional regulator involved in photosynthesis regulation [Synechococcus sp. A15-60]QNJ19517.1 AbrB-like transcriptional regulator involved in photosynthesis regulation [Synechococcus sp. A18-25c]|tara:strand:+ start:1387 stop:1758 length:372 start_codon:yes stop_codon:yes gene_type:complete
MLTGSDLLNKVKELGDVSKSDLVRACGYVSDKKNGGERLNFTAFYEALLEAKGVNLGPTGTSVIGKGGRKLSYVATVQGNGNLLIGKAYTAMLDLQPGDEFEIKLGRKQIRLVPVGGADEDDE